MAKLAVRRIVSPAEFGCLTIQQAIELGEVLSGVSGDGSTLHFDSLEEYEQWRQTLTQK
jgi:hypothetical protein